jgi:hypothetical protein
VNDIPRLIEQRPQALAFRLGTGGYYGQAIKKYLRALNYRGVSSSGA